MGLLRVAVGVNTHRGGAGAETKRGGPREARIARSA